MNKKTSLYASEQNCDLTGCEVILLYYGCCNPSAHVFPEKHFCRAVSPPKSIIVESCRASTLGLKSLCRIPDTYFRRE